MVTIMFETFQVRNVYVALTGVMPLYAVGRTTGLVCNSGYGVSHTTPVFEGFTIPHAVEKIDIAGRVLTDYMQNLLQETGLSLTSSAEMEIVRDILEKLCFVAENYEAQDKAAQKSSDEDKTYVMPCKSVITIPAHVRITCPELLFKPQLNYKSCKSIQEIIWKSIQASDVCVRNDLCKNIILSGGTTMYTGLPERLKNEIIALAPSGADIKIIAAADRKYAVWKGASILASLSSFTSSWVSAEEYQENGDAVAYRKCQ